VFRLSAPTASELSAFVLACSARPFNYGPQGATRNEEALRGFDRDRWGVDLGSGHDTFARAQEAVRSFAMYPPGWTIPYRAFDRIEIGAVFVTAIRHLGFWSLNPCRIIYVVDEGAASRVARFGFAFGTVEGHAEAGEERFTVTWDRDSDGVRFEAFAFSRPEAPLARLGKPIARALQRRFHRDSTANMLRAVAGDR
jgi:uncharacterized protein (UPF0548 family)